VRRALDARHGDQARGDQVPLTAVPVGGSGGSGGGHGWPASSPVLILVSVIVVPRGRVGVAWAKDAPHAVGAAMGRSSLRRPGRGRAPARPPAQLPQRPVAPAGVGAARRRPRACPTGQRAPRQHRPRADRQRRRGHVLCSRTKRLTSAKPRWRTTGATSAPSRAPPPIPTRSSGHDAALPAPHPVPTRTRPRMHRARARAARASGALRAQTLDRSNRRRARRPRQDHAAATHRAPVTPGRMKRRDANGHGVRRNVFGVTPLRPWAAPADRAHATIRCRSSRHAGVRSAARGRA
jgi:hypothetical protein